MDGGEMSVDNERHAHDLMNFVGIRAPLTAAALLQLIRELRRVNVLDDAALDRIKAAVMCEAGFFRRPHLPQADFEADLRSRLDDLFADVKE